MSRYIDADVLLNQLNKKIPEPGKMRYMEGFNDAIARVRSMVSSSSAVDVVPREEVVKLEKELTRYEQVCGKLIVKDGVGIGLLPDGKETVYILKSIASITKELAIRRTKQEVAREIFEEIEKVLENNEVYYRQTDEMRKQFAELKKKYVPEVT